MSLRSEACWLIESFADNISSACKKSESSFAIVTRIVSSTTGFPGAIGCSPGPPLCPSDTDLIPGRFARDGLYWEQREAGRHRGVGGEIPVSTGCTGVTGKLSCAGAFTSGVTGADPHLRFLGFQPSQPLDCFGDLRGMCSFGSLNNTSMVSRLW